MSAFYEREIHLFDEPVPANYCKPKFVLQLIRQLINYKTNML